MQSTISQPTLKLSYYKLEKYIKYKLAEIYTAYLLEGNLYLLKVSTNVVWKTEIELDSATMDQVGTRSDVM